MAAARQMALPLPEAHSAAEPRPAAAGDLVLVRLPDRMPAGLLAPRLAPMPQVAPPRPIWARVAHGVASLLAVALFVAFMASLALVAS